MSLYTQNFFLYGLLQIDLFYSSNLSSLIFFQKVFIVIFIWFLSLYFSLLLLYLLFKMENLNCINFHWKSKNLLFFYSPISLLQKFPQFQHFWFFLNLNNFFWYVLIIHHQFLSNHLFSSYQSKTNILMRHFFSFLIL